MQLEFDKQLKELTIKDDVPMYSKVVLFLMSINIVNLGLQLYSMSFEKNEVIYSVLSTVTIISIAVIVFYFFKKSWKTKYKLAEINGVETKKMFGRDRISLLLKNGRKRSFQALKTDKDVTKLKKTLSSMGIKSV
ncbi:hypothetical protein WH52_04640 [Tenacibaculum holothuriorum]|uniref:Uncharacterized protein n=1 Tax=Tenacibaculum holothuriorum TaxID=1635173 RepID=A0A1Y2PET9_9FLAO|nr:hypothetical protein [Tenacibaculum holothuriorum]OSY88955.1 hypothetical protein WH52_04640 [Tenacibaculum holothuriorum]